MGRYSAAAIKVFADQTCHIFPNFDSLKYLSTKTKGLFIVLRGDTVRSKGISTYYGIVLVPFIQFKKAIQIQFTKCIRAMHSYAPV